MTESNTTVSEGNGVSNGCGSAHDIMDEDFVSNLPPPSGADDPPVTVQQGLTQAQWPSQSEPGGEGPTPTRGNHVPMTEQQVQQVQHPENHEAITDQRVQLPMHSQRASSHTGSQRVEAQLGSVNVDNNQRDEISDSDDDGLDDFEPVQLPFVTQQTVVEAPHASASPTHNTFYPIRDATGQEDGMDFSGVQDLQNQVPTCEWM